MTEPPAREWVVQPSLISRGKEIVGRLAGVNPLTGGLGRRLLVWFLLFSLIPLFASNTIGYVRSDDIIGELVKRYLDGIARVQALHVQDQVDRSLLSLQLVSAGNEFLLAAARRSQGVGGGPMAEFADQRRVTEHLRRKLDELRAFEALYLYAPDGRLLVATSADDSGADIPHMISHPGEAMSLHRNSHMEGAPWLRLAAPVRTPEGELVAYLGGTISLGNPSQFLKLPEHTAGSVESFLVDERGRPLFISHIHGHTHYDEPLASPLVAPDAPPSARYTNREGREVIGTAVAIAGHPWRFIAEVPVRDALGPLRALRRMSIFLEFFFAFLVTGFAWLVAAGIVAPVRRLVAATRRVEGGDLSTRVEVLGDDEIDELGSAFNEMTDELEQSTARIRELHQREMERAGQLATVGELASGVAHEIKNPLVGISNGLDLMVKRVGRDSTLEPIVDEMQHQLSRIELAVRDLLTFARPSDPTLARSDANPIVERALRLVHPAAQKRRITVETELDSDLRPVWVDAEMMGQAVVNLVMNAVQATPDGGLVTVVTRSAAAGIELAIRDTGPGIVEERREKIFKPFFTTKHQGTGLGLSITREIIHRHGGTIRVDSEPGQGTTFTIILPPSGGEGPDEAATDAPASGSVS